MPDAQNDFDVREIATREPADFGLKKPEFAPGGKFQKKHLRLGAGVIFAIVLIVIVVFFLRGWLSFSKSKILLEIVAPSEISSGEELDFSIHYENNNRVGLKDGKIVLDYPEGTYSEDGSELIRDTVEVGKIPAKQEGIKNFKIRLSGEKGNIKTLAVRLSYRPENINSLFENSASFKINISSVLLGLYLVAPQKTISGKEITYALDYTNNSDEEFSDLRIEFKYPTGFIFKKPIRNQLKGTNIWQIGGLKKNEQGNH